MTRLLLAIALIVLSPVIAHAQTNPCTDPSPPGVTFNPTKLYFISPDHTVLEADGVTPRVTDYQVGYFAQSDTALATPVGPLTVILKTAVTLVTGTTNCYTTAAPPRPTTPQILISAVKSRRLATATIDGAESAWSTISNPFASAPTVLTRLGPVTVKR